MKEERRLPARRENYRCPGCAAQLKSKLRRHWTLWMIARRAARLTMLRMLKLATSSADLVFRSSLKRQKL